jgi:hypothetical protein
MRFVLEVITVGGSQPDFLGPFCSGNVFCAPLVSMSMSVVLRGAKKLRIKAALGGSLTVGGYWD